MPKMYREVEAEKCYYLVIKWKAISDRKPFLKVL